MKRLFLQSLCLPCLILGAVACGDEEYEVCDFADPDCPSGARCWYSGTGGESRCVPACSSRDDCNDGYVCQTFGDAGSYCSAPCNPDDPNSCGDTMMCEYYASGDYLCSEPVTFVGDVFDMTDDSAIGGAHVVAADETGAAATDVAITAADGTYSLNVPAPRNADGYPAGVFTLRVSAGDYLPYPYGIRPAIPVEASEAVYGDGAYVVDTPPTHVGLIPLDAADRGRGSISGAVTATGARGTLVVAEGGAAPAPFGFADASGTYTVFNVPDGSFEVRGYQAGLQLQPVDVTISGSQHLTGIDLVALDSALSTVEGQVNLVNAPGGAMTSVVLVPESTFNETIARGEVPPGLRAPEPGVAPNITGAFSIPGVPDGRYVVLAAFENDILVRDPDPSIAGTQIVHISVPDAGQGSTISLPDSFKVTEALELFGPGVDVPEPVSGNPTFEWADDSSEVGYEIVVYDAFGQLVWEDLNVDRVTGGEVVSVPYGGPPLEVGMYYQFRATSLRDTGPISLTEDLRGVFYIVD